MGTINFSLPDDNLTAAAMAVGLNEFISFTYGAVCVNLNRKPLPVITDT